MGGISDFVAKVDPLGSSIANSLGNNEMVQKFDPLGASLMQTVGGKNVTASSQGAITPQQQQQIMARQQMNQAMFSPQARQFMQTGQGYNSLPQGFNVMPQAWRGMQRPPQQMQPQITPPNFNVSQLPPYQNMIRQQMRPVQYPYQNMGMFGAFNPYMPRR